MGSNKFDGLTFCFTGKLETMTRKEANQLVTENGGTPKSEVIKDLSYLVTNSTDPTSKYAKAQEQGSKIITEEEFLANHHIIAGSADRCSCGDRLTQPHSLDT